MPKTEAVDYKAFMKSNLKKAPYVLKPNEGGSSIDTIIARDLSKVNEDQIKHIFNKHQTMLLQEMIDGIEITVSILGDVALEVIEIIPPKEEEFNYANKYNGKSQEICPPKNVSSWLQKEAKLLAETLHKLCDCRDMSRTDIMIDKTNRLYVLETNTIPGLTDQSLLPKAALASGISMSELCNSLVDMALARA